MRPAEFTPETIIQAGQELQATGRNITGFALRQKVGGGNPSRLKQVWDEYISSQAVTKAEPVAELPVEVADEMAAVTKALTDRLANLAVELNDKAVKAAERRVAEVIRTAGEQREQAERELADASQTVDDLENSLDEAKRRVEELENLLSKQRNTNQDLSIELAHARERLAVIVQSSKTAADEHIAELNRLNAGIDAERTRQRQEVDQIRAELAEQKKISQAVAAERDQIKAELATAKAKAEAASSEAARQVEGMRAELKEQKNAAQEAATERDQIRTELAAVKAKADAAEQVHQEQRKQAATEAHRMAERMTKANNNMEEANKEAREAREEAATLRGRIQALEEMMRQVKGRS